MRRLLFPGAALAVVFLGPLLGPWIELAFRPEGFAAWQEAERIRSLLFNSFLLFLFTSVIAVPWGAGLALVSERFAFRSRGVMRAAMLFGIVLPIPVVALSWQAALGNWIPQPNLAPGDIAWQPWRRGLPAAVWVHAMVGLPWVFAIVSLLLRRIDRGLEEEARIAGGGALVWRAVIRPRVERGILASAVWLALQTGTEIAVTDMMMVRTFAEEAYTQMVIGGPGIPHSLALVLPFQAIAFVVACWLVWNLRTERMLPTEEPPPLRGARGGRVGMGCFLVVSVVFVLGVPFASLVQRCGSANRVATVFHTEGRYLATSTAAALATGLLTAGLARRCCWCARTSPTFRVALTVLGIALATTPAPVLGFGLKAVIGTLVEWESGLGSWDFPPLRSLLYDQPSPVPSLWAAALRLFPLACLLLWPTITQIPEGLVEAATVDGESVWKAVVVPATEGTFHTAVFLLSALAMGEVAAAKLVNPPFFGIYILRLFDQMHYGTEASVASLALVQWFLSGILGVLWWITRTSSGRPGRVLSRSPGRARSVAP
jgi:iron(III) transport system permease protein